MKVRGWVYVISNPSMPGLLKVGYSRKDPLIRARELSSTGCPQPYRVEYDLLVVAPQKVEQETHQRLSSKRDGKEWFRCSLAEAITAINAVSAGRLATLAPVEIAAVKNVVTREDTQLQGIAGGTVGLPRYTRGNRSARWWYRERTGQLCEKDGSRQFGPTQCHFDGAGAAAGFIVSDRVVPWVPIDDVELID
jgi:hypothetical protein